MADRKKPTILFQSPGITIAFDPVAHTLAPYWRGLRPDGINHGFVDLRDRPELVDSIPEVQENPFLRNLLVVLNRKDSRFISLRLSRSIHQPIKRGPYRSGAFCLGKVRASIKQNARAARANN
jgi:hypothetical protein